MYMWKVKIMYTCFDNYVYMFASFFFCTHVCHNFYCTHVHSRMCTIFLLYYDRDMQNATKIKYNMYIGHLSIDQISKDIVHENLSMLLLEIFLLLKCRVIIAPSILKCTFLPYLQKDFYLIRASIFCTHVRHNLYCTHVH